jgi:DNA helicase II / ATP-dependent DNA helicase PcrA
MNLVRHERGLSENDRRFPLKDTCLAIYSRAVNAGESLEAVLLKQYPWCAEWHDHLRDLFEIYVEAKQNQHVLDYDDLLLYWGELMKVPELASEVRQLFDHVLVDEYQTPRMMPRPSMASGQPMCATFSTSPASLFRPQPW